MAKNTNISLINLISYSDRSCHKCTE